MFFSKIHSSIQFAMEKNDTKEEVSVLNFLSSPKWPNELRPLVAQHVTPKDLLVCRLICKEWRDQLQKEIFWKIKIPPQLLNTLDGFNGDYYRFFTRGGVRLIQTLDHVKIFTNADDPFMQSVPYLYEAQIGSDLGFRYIKARNDEFQDHDYARRFISAALKFDCPYLATPTLYVRDEGLNYVIFDNQFEGLEEYLKTIQPHQHNEGFVTTLVRQLIQATQYLHAHGFDLLSSEGLCFCVAKNCLNKIQLKIFNYGIGVKTNGRGIFLDYYRFTSPERVQLSEFSFIKSDLFSLGAITVYLLTGLPLYNVHPMQALFMLGGFQSYEIQDPNDELSDLAKDFILRFLQLKPDDRMTLEEALNHPWLTNPDPSTTPLQSAYEYLAPTNISVGSVSNDLFDQESESTSN